MGSFNVSCAISNLTIHEDDQIGFMLLIRRPDLHDRFDRAETRKFHVHSTDLYLPLLPPIYGVYGDYGDVTDIRPSNTTKLIEELFRRPVTDVVRAIGSGRSIYSSSSPIFELYMPSSFNDKKLPWDAPVGARLEHLGFTPTGEPETYSYRSYTVERTVVGGFSAEAASMEFDQWEIREGDRVLVSGVKTHPQFPVETLMDVFTKFTGLLVGFAEEDWDAIRLLNSVDGMFFLSEVSEKMKTRVVESNYDESAYDRIAAEYAADLSANRSNIEDIALGAGATPEEIELLNQVLRRSSPLSRSFGIPNDKLDLAKELLEVDDLVEAEKLLETMAVLNRMIAPTFSGTQFGEDKLSAELNRVTDTILSERIKNQYEDEDDD